MSNIKQSVTYGNAEVRGHLRQWKKQLAQDYMVFEEFYRELRGGRHQRLAVDLIKCTTAGRERALSKLKAGFGPGAHLTWLRLKKNQSMAVWTILQPREAMAVYYDLDKVSEKERGSMMQDCVTVNYALVGVRERNRLLIATGIWTLEVPDHALGRAVERSKQPHPGNIIMEAHRRLLRLPASLVEGNNGIFSRSTATYLKAGPGCFVSVFDVVGGPDDDDDELTMHAHVKTWLDENQLYEQQIVLSEEGEKGKRLGDSVFRPHALRRLVRNKGYIEVWAR